MWSAPIPQIVLAVEGRFDFVGKTNPFGAKKAPTKEQQARLNAQRTSLALSIAEAKRKQSE